MSQCHQDSESVAETEWAANLKQLALVAFPVRVARTSCPVFEWVKQTFSMAWSSHPQHHTRTLFLAECILNMGS